jgi:predicted ferric reductase
MLLLSVTFFAKWRYQILKFIHQILGFAFFFGGLHALLIPSDISRHPLLLWYTIILALAGIWSYTYRSLLSGVLVGRYTYIVKAVNVLDATVTEVVLYPEGKPMHYLPGQFMFISFVDSIIGKEVHPFSISSAPLEPTLRVTIKALGDYTKNIRNIQVGTVAKIEGPFGEFSYLRGKNLSQIWIAGGIGITPFLNMARNLSKNMHTGHQIDFYYSAKTKEEMVFLAELEAISALYPKFRVFPYNADVMGFLTMDAVEKMSGTLVGKDIYVCGPPPMMNGIIAQCRAKNVPKSLIHSEQFKLL